MLHFTVVSSRSWCFCCCGWQKQYIPLPGAVFIIMFHYSLVVVSFVVSQIRQRGSWDAHSSMYRGGWWWYGMVKFTAEFDIQCHCCWQRDTFSLHGIVACRNLLAQFQTIVRRLSSIMVSEILFWILLNGWTGIVACIDSGIGFVCVLFLYSSKSLVCVIVVHIWCTRKTDVCRVLSTQVNCTKM